MPENGTPLTEDIGEYRQRVRGLERQQDAFAQQLANLSSKIDERFTSLQNTLAAGAKTPWNNILAACGVTIAILSAMVGAITLPITAQIADIKQSSKESRIELADAIIRARTERIDQIGELRRYVDENLKDVRAQIVPRAEHDRSWTDARLKDEAVQKQIANIEARLTGFGNAGDMIKMALTKTERLEEMFNAIRGARPIIEKGGN